MEELADLLLYRVISWFCEREEGKVFQSFDTSSLIGIHVGEGDSPFILIVFGAHPDKETFDRFVGNCYSKWDTPKCVFLIKDHEKRKGYVADTPKAEKSTDFFEKLLVPITKFVGVAETYVACQDRLKVILSKNLR